jgi:hypothetical protein
VVDSSNGRVRKIDITTATVSTITTAVGYSRDIITDGTNLYVCSYSANSIRKVVTGTGAVTDISGSITKPNYLPTDGTKLYVTDESSYLIHSIE